jgi:hypothetical protein
MAEDREPIEVPLSEKQRAQLEAAELRVALEKERTIAEIQKRYAVAQALEIKEALSGNAKLKVKELSLKAVTEAVIQELSLDLPDGYKPVLLEWERGRAVANYFEFEKPESPEEPEAPKEEAPPVE